MTTYVSGYTVRASLGNLTVGRFLPPGIKGSGVFGLQKVVDTSETFIKKGSTRKSILKSGSGVEVKSENSMGPRLLGRFGTNLRSTYFKHSIVYTH